MEDEFDFEALLLSLAQVDAKAKAAGHSLVEILAVAAKNAFGVDVRPDAPPPEEDEVAQEAPKGGPADTAMRQA